MGALPRQVRVPERHAVVPGAQVRICQQRNGGRRSNVAQPACPHNRIPLGPGLQGAALEGLFSPVVSAIRGRTVLQTQEPQGLGQRWGKCGNVRYGGGNVQPCTDSMTCRALLTPSTTWPSQPDTAE